jgi:pimeloyl-ACP methyl ester carboxylesterase
MRIDRARLSTVERPAVVFLHGLLGDATQWFSMSDYHPLTEYADAYYVDFHFELRRESPLGFAEIVRELRQLLSHGPGIDHPDMTFVGSSFGGHVAVYLAAHRLADPAKLVLFAPGGIPELAQQRGMLQSYRTIDKILEVSFDRLFSDPAVAKDPKIRASIARYRDRIEPYKRNFFRNLIDVSRQMREFVIQHSDLRRIPVPTLLVWGRRDIVTPPEICDIYLRHLPASEVAWIDSGHAGHVECPEASGRLLRHFVLHRTLKGHAAERRVAAIA